MTTPRVPDRRPRPVVPSPSSLTPRHVPTPFEISFKGVVCGLPQTSRIVHGVTQPPTLKRFVAGDLMLAAHLGELFDAILDRSQDEDEQDLGDVVVEHIALEWRARKAMRRRQPAPDVHVVSRAEYADDAALDLAQHDAANPQAPLSAFYRLRDCALRMTARAKELAHAAAHRIEEHERAQRGACS